MGEHALEVLVIGAAFVSLMVVFGTSGCSSHDTASAVTTINEKTPFDGKRAFRHVEKLVAIGPHPSDSPGIREAQEYIREQLAGLEIETRTNEFVATTPLGDKKMCNIVGVVEGTSPEVVIVGTHYETKFFDAFEFVGANDSGSSTGLVLELGRILGPQREGCTVWLTFFDGEECFKRWSATDGLYGSRHFAEHLKTSGELDRVKAVVVVDMIGDSYLQIKKDRGAPAWLVEAVWSSARELGYTLYFTKGKISVEDDHIPFRRAGIPAIDIIDFTYGRTYSDHRRNWHTPNDTIDKVSPDSLKTVGDVVHRALGKIDSHVLAHATEVVSQ